MPLPEDKSGVKREVKPHVPIPEDTYTVQVWDIELEKGDAKAKQDWLREDRMRISFVILDLKYRGIIFNKMASFSFNAGSGKRYNPSTLYGLACAVTGEKLDDREVFEANSLIGKQCRIVCKHGDETDDGSVWEKITDFMAVKKELDKMTEKELEAIQLVRKEEAQEAKEKAEKK